MALDLLINLILKYMEKFEITSSFEYSKEQVLKSINYILDWKYENPENIWTQQSEFEHIAGYWNKFDEESKILILSAIPEIAKFLLKKKLKLEK